jgi:hypothetical protein
LATTYSKQIAAAALNVVGIAATLAILFGFGAALAALLV